MSGQIEEIAPSSPWSEFLSFFRLIGLLVIGFLTGVLGYWYAESQHGESAESWLAAALTASGAVFLCFFFSQLLRGTLTRFTIGYLFAMVSAAYVGHTYYDGTPLQDWLAAGVGAFVVGLGGWVTQEVRSNMTMPHLTQGLPRALVRCEKCGKEKSKKANACPHCGHRGLKSSHFSSCRACGTTLEKAVYRFYSSAESFSIVDGTSRSTTVVWVTHKPCPKCGEPKPLFNLVWFTAFLQMIWLSLTAGLLYYGYTVFDHYDAERVRQHGLIMWGRPVSLPSLWTPIGIAVLLWAFATWMLHRVNRKHIVG